MPVEIPYWYAATPLDAPHWYVEAPDALTIADLWEPDLARLRADPDYLTHRAGFEVELAVPELGQYLLVSRHADPGERADATRKALEGLGKFQGSRLQARRALQDKDSPLNFLSTGEVVIGFGRDVHAQAIRHLLETQGDGWQLRRDLAPYAPQAFVLRPPVDWTLERLARLVKSLRAGDPGAAIRCVYPVALRGKLDACEGHSWHLSGRLPGGGSDGLGSQGADVIAAWPRANRGRGVTIGIIERTYVDVEHPQLRVISDGSPREISLWDLSGELPAKRVAAPLPQDGGVHATQVASVAVAAGRSERDATGQEFRVCGVAPDAGLVAVRCAAGGGSIAESDAFCFAGQHAQVISCSWRPFPRPPGVARMPDHTRWAIQWVVHDQNQRNRSAVCFASGNWREEGDVTELNEYASHEDAIAVGASDFLGRRAKYSVQGAAVACLFPSGLDGAGFGDPRRLIPSALPRGYGGEHLGGSYDFRWFGYTSAACAGLAGVIALMLAVNPRLAPAEIKALLHASSGAARAHSTDRAGPATGGPSCVDAARAVEAAELLSARPRQ